MNSRVEGGDGDSVDKCAEVWEDAFVGVSSWLA